MPESKDHSQEFTRAEPYASSTKQVPNIEPTSDQEAQVQRDQQY